MKTTAQITVHQDETEFGGPQPLLKFEWPDGSLRAARAEVLRIAAAIEEASEGEAWCVNVPGGPGVLGRGRMGCAIEIELMKSTPEEAARAMAVLRKVAGPNASETGLAFNARGKKVIVSIPR